MVSKLMLDLARPFLRHSPRFTGFVYDLLGGNRDAAWSRYGLHVTRGTDHGYRMVLNLADWSDRAAYYHGRYYDVASLELIRKMLSPGDTFVDVGANVGMLTLTAASVVGQTGAVLAFEPNPRARGRLCENLRINDLQWVRVLDKALSCERARGVLTMATEHTGQGTLRTCEGASAAAFEVETGLLDDCLPQIPPGRRTLLKIDTEGFEFNVIKGARQLLARPQVSLLVEVNDKWLRELGQTAAEMFAYMDDLGYAAYHARIRPKGLRQDLIVEPLSLPGPHHWFDAIFARKEEAGRLFDA